jgi:hypothetical protein
VVMEPEPVLSRTSQETRAGTQEFADNGKMIADAEEE